MSQYQAVLELSSLDGTNGFKINGEASLDRSGISVSSVGDVNGDGFDDIIVGADSADPNGSASGASYVVFGKASGFGATFDLSSLDGNNGFQINGVAADDRSGQSVSSAGDVNGDGIDDIIVGAPQANGNFSGASYVVFGSTDPFNATLELSGLDGVNGFTINGEAANDFSGVSVSSAGDVNGDGFDDLIVGARYANANNSGASYVVFGHPSGDVVTLELSGLDGTNGFKINGELADDANGSVSSAGDVNGDGFDDVIVGAFAADPNGSRSGASYVVFGKSSGFAATLELSSLDGVNGFKLNGEAGDDFSGWSVSGAGDVNADGFADVIVGAYRNDAGSFASESGASYVLFGKATGFGAALTLSALNGTDGFRINGKGHEFSGYSVSSAGDFNGDGFADLIVGAPDSNPHGANSGASYVVFGKAAGFGAELGPASLDGNNGFRINGVTGADYSGRSVSSAGDVNGDGFDDLMVGARLADPHGSASGATYVIFGSMPGEAVVRTGSSIANTIHGGDFDDTLDGLGGNDILLGHAGKDKLRGGEGADVLNGGGGNDTATYNGASGGVSAALTSGGAFGEAAGDTYISIQNLTGSAWRDFLIGDAFDNSLSGGSGNDVLSGGSGTDSLTGGPGNDALEGGSGADTLNGGPGFDHFFYQTAADSTGLDCDTIKKADFAADAWDVQGTITDIDMLINRGALRSDRFDTDLATATDGKFDANHAVLFTPSSGDLAGKMFLIIDQNEEAGYQAGSDLVTELKGALNLANIDSGDFI